MKVKIDNTKSIVVSPEGQAVILVILYFKTFKTDVIVFICNVTMCLMSH